MLKKGYISQVNQGCKSTDQVNQGNYWLIGSRQDLPLRTKLNITGTYIVVPL